MKKHIKDNRYKYEIGGGVSEDIYTPILQDATTSSSIIIMTMYVSLSYFCWTNGGDLFLVLVLELFISL